MTTLLVALHAAAPVSADTRQSPTAAAHAAYREGRARFDTADYQGALERFRRTYVLDPQPVLLYDIAQVERRLGRWSDAATTYQRYLADDKTLTPQRRARVEAFMRECEQRAREDAARMTSARPTPRAAAVEARSPTTPSPAPAPSPGPALSSGAPAPAPALAVSSTTTAPPHRVLPLSRRRTFWLGLAGGTILVAAGVGLTIGLMPRDATVPLTDGGNIAVDLR